MKQNEELGFNTNGKVKNILGRYFIDPKLGNVCVAAAHKTKQGIAQT